MDVDEYLRLIRLNLPRTGSIAVSDLEMRVAHALSAPIEREVFDEALQLEASAEVYRGGLVRMVEPDLPEASLMARVGAYLSSAEAISKLQLSPGMSVVEDTSQTGARGMGEYSRPDFVIATIRKFRYDPSVHLDLISFELKNRAGSNLKGVHETLAHGRFAHYSYYVIPRSRLRSEQTDQLIQACSQYDLGVITFTIGQNDSVGHFRFEQYAKRRANDPYVVENFIDKQLSQASRDRLERLARDPHG